MLAKRRKRGACDLFSGWTGLHPSHAISLHTVMKANIQFSFLSLIHTDLIVHERFQALDEFMLVPFINTLLPEEKKKK